MEHEYVNPLRHAVESETERLERLQERKDYLSERYNKIRAPHRGYSLALRIFFLGVIIGIIKPYINAMRITRDKMDKYHTCYERGSHNWGLLSTITVKGIDAFSLTPQELVAIEKANIQKIDGKDKQVPVFIHCKDCQAKRQIKDGIIREATPSMEEVDKIFREAPSSSEFVIEKIQRAINYITRTADPYLLAQDGFINSYDSGRVIPTLKTFQLAKADVDWNREGRKGPVFVTKRLPAGFDRGVAIGHAFTKATKSKPTKVRTTTPVVQTPKVIDRSKVINARIRDTISHVEKVLRDGGCVKREQNLAIHGTAHCHWCDSLLKEQKDVDATILHIRNRAAENEETHEKALEIAKESEKPEVVKDLIRTLADCRGFRLDVNKKGAAEALRMTPGEMRNTRPTSGYKSRKPIEIEQATSLRDVQRIAQEEGWDNEAMSRIPGTDAYRVRMAQSRSKPKEEVKQEEVAPEPKKPRRKFPTHRQKIQQIAS